MIKEYGLIIVLMTLLMWFPLPAGAQEQLPGMSMDVTGQAVIRVPPDQAVIVFSVETSGPKAATALEKNAQLTDKVIQVLKKTAGKDAAVSTSSFHVHPVYDEREDGQGVKHAAPAPRAYRVRNSIAVETRRMDGIGELIDAAVAAGATRVGSLSFSRSDGVSLQRQAAAMALKNAIENAKVLAQAADISLKGITYIQFVPNMIHPGGAEMIMAEGDVLTPVIPGQITVESYVNVTYELAR